MGPQTNSNNFFGIAVSLPGINVNQASPSQMMYTNDYSTTTWRDKNGNITLQEGQIPSTNSYGQLSYYSGIPQTLSGTRVANSQNGLSANEQGFFVSQSGTNVLNATDSQLIFNSNQNILKVVLSDTLNVPTVTVPTSTTYTYYATIAHNLGVVPYAQVILNGESQVGITDGWQSSSSTVSSYPTSAPLDNTSTTGCSLPVSSGELTLNYNQWFLDSDNLYIIILAQNSSSTTSLVVSSFTVDYVIFLPVTK